MRARTHITACTRTHTCTHMRTERQREREKHRETEIERYTEIDRDSQTLPTTTTRKVYTDRNLLKGPGHHGDEEVDENDDDGDVVKPGQNHAHLLRHTGRLGVGIRHIQGVLHGPPAVDPPEHRAERHQQAVCKTRLICRSTRTP